MGPNLKKLIQNTESASKSLSAPGFNMNDFMLPDSGVVKNILMNRNPNMSESDVDLMVYGLDNDGSKSRHIEDMESLYKEGDTPYKRREIDNKVKESKENFNNLRMPIPEGDHTYEEAKELKRDMADKSTLFVRKTKELIQDSVQAGIVMSQAPSGGSLLVAAPSISPAMNIPGLMTMVMNVLLTVNSLKSKYEDVKAIFIHFSKVKDVCSPSDAEKVASILNKMNSSVDSSIKPILSKLDNFKEESISVINDTTNPEKEGNRIENITIQLRRMGYLPNDNFNDVDTYDKLSVENILEEWVVINRTHETRAVRRKQKYLNLIEDAKNSVVKIGNISSEIEELTNIDDFEIDDTYYVYDIELPDGTIIENLTENEIEGYKETYDVIYSNSSVFKKSNYKFSFYN